MTRTRALAGQGQKNDSPERQSHRHEQKGAGVESETPALGNRQPANVGDEGDNDVRQHRHLQQAYEGITHQ